MEILQEHPHMVLRPCAFAARRINWEPKHENVREIAKELNLGLESLHVRMPRHVENGQAVAEYLHQHKKVAHVSYPGLPGDKYYELAQKYMPDGGCGVVSFELEGGRPAAEVFMKHLKLAAIETHVADARTCCLNPATSTHRQMNDEQLLAAGIPAGLIRISCGLEDKEDLIADLAQALEAI